MTNEELDAVEAAFARANRMTNAVLKRHGLTATSEAITEAHNEGMQLLDIERWRNNRNRGSPQRTSESLREHAIEDIRRAEWLERKTKENAVAAVNSPARRGKS